MLEFEDFDAGLHVEGGVDYDRADMLAAGMTLHSVERVLFMAGRDEE